MNYQTILTQTGLIKQAAAIGGGAAVRISEIAIGDAGGMGYTPDGSETALRGEVWRSSLFNTTLPDAAPGALRLEAILPANVGGWTMRELGLFDDDGDLIAIGALPGWEKPTGAEALADMILRINLQVADSSVFQVIVDPMAYVTRGDVDSAIAAAIQALQIELTGTIDSTAQTLRDEFATAIASNTQTLRGEIEDAKNEVIEEILNSDILFPIAARRWTTLAPAFAPEQVYGMACSPSAVVIVGENGKVMRSTDLETFQDISIPNVGSNILRGVAYGNDRFVLAGANGNIAISDNNGETWTHNGIDNDNFGGIVFGAGRFFTWHYNRVYSSQDGVSWSYGGNTGLTRVDFVATSDTRVVAIGDNKAIYSDNQGTTWSAPTTTTLASDPTHLMYGGGVFLITDALGNVYRSTDGVNWEQHATPISGTGMIEFITYHKDLFVAVGNNAVLLSSDGAAWELGSGFNINGRAVTYGLGCFIAGGSSGSLARSIRL